jgi:hypothetical protein
MIQQLRVISHSDLRNHEMIMGQPTSNLFQDGLKFANQCADPSSSICFQLSGDYCRKGFFSSLKNRFSADNIILSNDEVPKTCPTTTHI